MANLSSLARRMRSLKREIADYRIRVKREVTLEMLHYLTNITPVDTSLAISNWQVRLGGDGRIIEAHLEGEYGSTKSFSSQVANNFGELVLRELRPESVVTLYNYTPYIEQLDTGKSVQAQDFVKGAIMRGRAKIGAVPWKNV